MEINSLQGANAYTNLPNAATPLDNSALRDQNLEASGTKLDAESTNAAQKAFEVTITPEAQDKLAAEPAETQATTPENQTRQNIVSAHETNRIVNIIA
ncbi:MAG: hypothetical protein K8S13_22715 [Desulfobacula sp.]|uniref:hypothetical protein n=1 Tax=Desulfobacula sp. TaxID=2593537 RepID=UPI0025C471F5|nr:hypothetical protein [Desulfobacula sp.]MCD4722643.1 hypothetical protein [Desulfobacula sp.]